MYSYCGPITRRFQPHPPSQSCELDATRENYSDKVDEVRDAIVFEVTLVQEPLLYFEVGMASTGRKGIRVS